MLRIGETLLQRGLITQKDLDSALAVQTQVGGLLGQILVRMGALAETDLLTVLSESSGYPVISQAALPGADTVKAAVERTKCSLRWLLSKDAVVWFESEAPEAPLCCASRNPLDLALQEAADQWSDAAAPLFYFASQHALEQLLEDLGKEHAAETQIALGQDAQRLREMAEEAPTIDFVNAIFNEGVNARASDIHIEPLEDRFVVRLRVDGILSTWRTAPQSAFDAVASRIKLLSGMDIAERRLPQDGRWSIRSGGREVDVRVSSLPTTWGESIVMRLLGKTKSLPTLDELGVAADHQAMLRELIAKPHGVLLITGPTGSGKTTTIYRLLSELNDGVRKIVTVEDPVEFDLPGVMQVHVRQDIGLSFAAGLRSILRQDPDIIMVGEIRDSETARICVQAALTGHLVISTVHTNSALAAAPRLLDLGAEAFLLADVLRGVVGQRLVRRLCRACAQSAAAPARGGAALARSEPAGCAACGHTGYRGRVGIYEVVEIDEDIAAGVRAGENEQELTKRAQRRGFRSMYEDGLVKVNAGETTLSEVMRLTSGSD